VKKIIVAIPHSHTWLWSQTCIASLQRNPPKADGYEVEIVVINNSPWSPAIRGLTDTSLGYGIEIISNYKTNRFHASALDCVVECFGDMDLLMALETDVMALRPTWLQWFVDQLQPNDYAVGMWHHEQFVNPSCTLYRGDVLCDMLKWCLKDAPQDELRWGPNFSLTAPLDNNLPLTENPASALQNIKSWIAGPFAEKRGWPEGSVLREQPSGQLKGPGWYEPGQQLHHRAVELGYTYTVCPNQTTFREDHMPLQSMYGVWGTREFNFDRYPSAARLGRGDVGHNHGRQLEAVELFGNAETVHLWGGTRALDILKHPVTCQFVKANTPMWLAREARFWRHVVPEEVQRQTLDLIRQYGWHITGQGADHVSQRDQDAAEYVRNCYRAGGVEW